MVNSHVGFSLWFIKKSFAHVFGVWRFSKLGGSFFLLIKNEGQSFHHWLIFFKITGDQLTTRPHAARSLLRCGCRCGCGCACRLRRNGMERKA
jgi:hypothetical protein